MGCCGNKSMYRQTSVSGATMWYVVILVVLFVVVAISPFLGPGKISTNAYVPLIVLLVGAFAVAGIAAVVYNNYYRKKGVSWDQCGLYALFTFVIPLLVLLVFVYLMSRPRVRALSEQMFDAVVNSSNSVGAGLSIE